MSTIKLSAEEALKAINELRSNVISTQTAGWSTLVYPLVAILDAAGYERFESNEEQIQQHLETYGGAGGFPGRIKNVREERKERQDR